MPQPPSFWNQGGARLPALVLSPLSRAVSAATARRVARPGWRAPVPVICCGNAGVGGAGKTTLALDLTHRLLASGAKVHVLTRGHGGRLAGPLRVDPAGHDARDVGDEALLLSAAAPTWLGADRAASARAAVAEGAQVLVMDDGLQNPTLCKDFSLLVIDGAAGFGNCRVLPAGPLREPVSRAAERSQAAVLIGPDRSAALAALPPELPVLRATLSPGPEVAAYAGKSVVAFAGIGRPEKFFAMLEDSGVSIIRRMPFPDHRRFSPIERARIIAVAKNLNVAAVTTPKDYVRIPEGERFGFAAIGVSLAWEDSAKLKAILDGVLRGALPRL